VSTQLRLVEPPATRKPKPAKATKPPKSAVSAARRPSRRTVNWGDWRLDARTRSVGRAGVANARRVLEAAAAEQLSQAS
jgi:hypothetical protein